MSEAAFAKARAELAKLPGFKQSELKPCAVCGKGLAHDGNFLFWRLKFERLGIDHSAVQRQHGLELMLGSPAIARVMGPDEDIAKVLDGPTSVLVCEPCVTERMIGLFLIAEKQDDPDTARTAGAD